MKKSIFLFFAAILCAIGMNAANVGFEGYDCGIKYSVNNGSATEWNFSGQTAQSKTLTGNTTTLTLKEWFACMYQDQEGTIYGKDYHSLQYKVHRTAIAAGTSGFKSVGANWWSWEEWDWGYRKPKGGHNSQNINLLEGIGSGKYTMTFYFQHNGDKEYKSTINTLNWTTNAPDVASVTCASNGTGSGTESDPFLIPVGETLTLTVSATQQFNDPNSVLYAKFGSNDYSTTLAYDITPTSTKQSITIGVKYYNSADDLTGTEKTITIYYQALEEETHDVVISYLCESEDVETSKTVKVGVSTKSNITAPEITGYTFANWTLGAGVATEDELTANPISITTKSGETDYTLTANYNKIQLTYNVTVPAGSKGCYIAGDMNTWSFTEMTKVDDTHYTITIDGATADQTYKYASSGEWKYVEVKEDGGDVDNRTYSENDVVAKWKAMPGVYLAGGMNGWNTTANEFVDGTLSVDLAASSTIEFKIVKDGDWLGNGEEIKADNCENVSIGTGGNNCKITTGVAGSYTFTWDNTNTQLSVTYPEAPTPEPEPTELTYNVTVPEGTNTCYIAMDVDAEQDGWEFTEMTKVDDTHYTITITGAKKTNGYKYASGPEWGYVEKDASGNEIGNRTYVDGNDVVARWASIYDPDAVEQELTYSVTVPEGTYACYIAMDTDPAQDGWEFNEMTKVDDTHYTFTRTGLKNKTYKYASGAGWEYVEKTAEDGEVADRTWAENDVVAKWASVYNPTAPTYDYYIAGNEALLGVDKNWGSTPAGKGMDKGADGLYTATFTLSANTEYEFKITDGQWNSESDNSHEHTTLAAVYVGVTGGNGNNIKVNLAEAKELTITFNSTEDKIYLNLDEETASLTYRVQVPEGTEACYIAGPCNSWAFREMTREGTTNIFTIDIVGAKETDEYKYACKAEWAYAEVREADENGNSNRKAWTALDEVTAWNKPVVYTYYLMGVNGDWATGIKMVRNEANTDAEEYMLTCQPVNGNVKIKRLGDDESEYWYGGNSLKTAEGSLGANTSTDGGDGDIALATGIYNFYFNATDGKLWIAAATDCVFELGDGDNSNVLVNGVTVNLKVTRSFASGTLYTLVLPFAMDNNTVKSIFGTSVELYDFTSLSENENEELILSFTEQETPAIVAGTPYLIKPETDANGFDLTGVKINTATNPVAQTYGTTTITMQPILSAAAGAETNGASQYWLAADNNLYNNKVSIKGLRAIFDVQTTKANVRARAAFNENETTGVDNIVTTDTPVKVIENGQLIIIRDGVKYNVQGQKL